MGSKLALIISMGFIVMALAFSGDLIAIQVIHSQLDAISITVSRMISYSGTITSEIESFATKDGKTYIYSPNQAVKVGSAYEYYLYRYYDPLFISSETMRITVRRSAVVGYF